MAQTHTQRGFAAMNDIQRVSTFFARFQA